MIKNINLVISKKKTQIIWYLQIKKVQLFTKTQKRQNEDNKKEEYISNI